jgi:hypothetical protein
VDLRRAEQEWLSRQLHDDLGPSLCAAGLQLSLFRTGAGDNSAASAEALDNVQTILERTVDTVRLLSYTISPGSAAKCGLRDMVRMMARAFQVEGPEIEGIPPSTPEASVEVAGQLLDCFLLLPPANAKPPARLFLRPDSVTLNVPGRLRRLLAPVAARSLARWTCTLRERTSYGHTTITWNLPKPKG